MKKTLSALFVFIFVLFRAFAINSKLGYEKLYWGSTLQDAKKKYRLEPMNSIGDKEKLSELYTSPVDAYRVRFSSEYIKSIQFHFYHGKLFLVKETLNTALNNRLTVQKQLENRYGIFTIQDIVEYDHKYTDTKREIDGSVSSSITISESQGICTAIMYDWNVYKNISVEGQRLSQGEKSVQTATGLIIDDLKGMANKLVQEKAGGKPTFAFLSLTTDYGNSFVDDYVTDSLVEAMFNTGKIKIVERANLEKVKGELMFQQGGLVDENTAKSIGLIVGADFVCFGTLKDIGESLIVNVRVVDVETGELCAISRATIMKDEYLRKQSQRSVSPTETIVKSGRSGMSKTTVTSASNAWNVTSYEDSFVGSTYYIFTVNSSDSRMLFISYKKSDNPANSKVISGIHWTIKDNWDDNNEGNYDIKGTNGVAVSKKLTGRGFKCLLNSSGTKSFYYAWNPNEGARWLVEMMTKSDSVAVRHNGLNRRFKTAGLLDKMSEFGITWKEIDEAMSNEEF